MSKPGYRTVSQFATVKSAEQEAALTVTLPVNPPQVARATFPTYDALPPEMRRILHNSVAGEGMTERGPELYAALSEIQKAALLNVLAFAGALGLPDGSTVSSHIQGLLRVRADGLGASVDAGLRDAIVNAMAHSTFRQVPQALLAVPQGFTAAGSFKSANNSLALEVTFYGNVETPTRFIADMNIDSLGGFSRAFQVGRAQNTGAVHPYDVQQLLVYLLKIDPLYRPLP